MFHSLMQFTLEEGQHYFSHDSIIKFPGASEVERNSKLYERCSVINNFMELR